MVKGLGFCIYSFVALQIAPLVVGEGGDANNPHRQTYIEIGRVLLFTVLVLAVFLAAHCVKSKEVLI